MVVKTAFLKKTYSKPKMETNMALIRDMHPPSSTVTQLAVPGNSWLYLSPPGTPFYPLFGPLKSFKL